MSVLVSGAASGIGRAVVERLHADGATVLAADVDEHGLSHLPEGVLSIVGDLTDPTVCAGAVATLDAREAMTGLVCSTGLELHGTVETTTLVEWNRVLAVNLTSMFLLAKAAVPALRRNGGGCIVLLSSTQAFATQRDVAAYAASKGAVVALTRAMALDHADDGIRVVCIAPGTVDTPMVRANAAHFGGGDVEAQLARWGDSHALGRVGTVAEIADVIAFVLSEQASFVTGTTWQVDGGLLASF